LLLSSAGELLYSPSPTESSNTVGVLTNFVRRVGFEIFAAVFDRGIFESGTFLGVIFIPYWVGV